MDCLFCRSENISEASYPRPSFFNNKLFSYKHCRDCGLVFIDPLPSGDDYDKMYAKTYHNEFYFKEVTPDYSNWRILLEKYRDKKKIVDYGCGDGSFLKYFASAGYECTGVEYDPELVTRLQKDHPGIVFYTVEEFWQKDPGKKFDMIFMGDVLEHIATPSDFLKNLMQKIETNGLIAAQGPLENNTTLALGFRKFSSRLKLTLYNYLFELLW